MTASRLRNLTVAILTVGIVGLLAGIGAGVWLLLAEPFLPRQRLPDGSRLTLRGVTFGTTHEIEWRGWLTRLLPEPSGLLVARPGTFSTPRSSVVLWVESDKAYRRGVPVQRLDGTPVDDHGCTFPTRPAGWDRSSLPNTGRRFLAFEAYPRRSPAFSLEIREGGPMGEAAVLR